MTTPGQVWNSVAVADPNNPSNVLIPNSAGGISTTPTPATTVARLPSSLASVNATLVKNAPGTVFFIGGVNTNAAIRYLKLYNKASAPVIGTDTPFMTFALPASSPFNIPIGGSGIAFSIGIGFGLTVNAPDADATAVAAGDILGLNISYT